MQGEVFGPFVVYDQVCRIPGNKPICYCQDTGIMLQPKPEHLLFYNAQGCDSYKDHPLNTPERA